MAIIMAHAAVLPLCLPLLFPPSPAAATSRTRFDARAAAISSWFFPGQYTTPRPHSPTPSPRHPYSQNTAAHSRPSACSRVPVSPQACQLAIMMAPAAAPPPPTLPLYPNNPLAHGRITPEPIFYIHALPKPDMILTAVAYPLVVNTTPMRFFWQLWFTRPQSAPTVIFTGNSVCFRGTGLPWPCSIPVRSTPQPSYCITHTTPQLA